MFARLPAYFHPLLEYARLIRRSSLQSTRSRLNCLFTAHTYCPCYFISVCLKYTPTQSTLVLCWTSWTTQSFYFSKSFFLVNNSCPIHSFKIFCLEKNQPKMSFLNRLAGLLGLSSTPSIPPGAALAATVTTVCIRSNLQVSFWTSSN